MARETTGPSALNKVTYLLSCGNMWIREMLKRQIEPEELATTRVLLFEREWPISPLITHFLMQASWNWLAFGS